MNGFEQLKRDRIPLLIGVAGGTGSGKTMSALLLARGMAGGKPFAGIDTENGRMSHYADLFPDCHAKRITAPFRPSKYADAVEEAQKAGYGVVVVDSASHEWYGDGGCLDWHDELMGGDQRKNLSAWIEPKRDHKRMVTRLLQLNAHVIMCFRAEPKVEAVRGENGRIEIVPKASLTGLDGWIPISEKNLPYELTASFLLMADRPGFPKPIKLQSQHREFVPLDSPLSEETGRKLAAWAAGGTSSVGVREAGGSADGKTADPVAPTDSVLATDPQKVKLNVLVGQLRDAGHITTLQLWAAVGRDPWAEGHGDDPHWSPLRDSLTKDEASALIERLDKFAETKAAA
jgi:hypothetical protein